MFSIILAGGSGTRLWPLSRSLFPKQFVSFKQLSWNSLFQETLIRASMLSEIHDIRIVTNRDYKFHCLTQASEIGIILDESQILLEPIARNTLPAITYAMFSLPEQDAVACILPSDHVIPDRLAFVNLVKSSESIANTSLVTFGIHPTFPNTGYGYIAPQNAWVEFSKVKAFKEKPSVELATKYIQDGYLWNSGIFCFSRAVFEQEMSSAAPKILEQFQSLDNTESVFQSVPEVSIDYGLLEKTNNIIVFRADIVWDDLGSFDAIDKYFFVHSQNEDVISVDASDNTVISQSERKIAVVGLNDLIIVDTPDALLVSRKWETQKVKQVYEQIREKNPDLAKFGRTVYRPWGSYTIIDEGNWFKSKRLTVLPWKKLSSQMHYHRSEHWVVVSGTAKVSLDDAQILLQKGESTFIVAGTKHRLENPGKLPLHVIESQIGDYLEEDDIVRFDDDFWRC